MVTLLALLAACSDAPPEDSSPPEEDGDTEIAEDCDDLHIQVDGEDPPSVGDTWTTLLVCDDVILLGATRVLWTPPDIATVSENVSTFVQAGDATLKLQTGSRWAERTVTVAP